MRRYTVYAIVIGVLVLGWWVLSRKKSGGGAQMDGFSHYLNDLAPTNNPQAIMRD